ncbi:MAG: hypothetical protein MJ159_02485 [Treponemataceae bacterium]|nr:hypothetical protein [Treponemataceae bacterium]
MAKQKQKQFLDYWFSGFSDYLDVLVLPERQKLMAHCGKACADSYVMQIYQDAWKSSSGNITACIRLVHEKLAPDIIYEPVDESGVPSGKSFDVMYTHCRCELVNNKYISTPLQCECSRQNLLYIWETLLGKGNVSVERKKTILSGDSCCIFRVTFR